MKDQLREISNALKSVLKFMPPDLAGDVVENGIVLTGGGALIRGLDKYLSDIVRLPVYVARAFALCGKRHRQGNGESRTTIASCF